VSWVVIVLSLVISVLAFRIFFGERGLIPNFTSISRFDLRIYTYDIAVSVTSIIVFVFHCWGGKHDNSELERETEEDKPGADVTEENRQDTNDRPLSTEGLPATKHVQFVDLENVVSQNPRSTSVRRGFCFHPKPRPTGPRLSRAERKTFVEFFGSLKSRIANSGSELELEKFDISVEEEDDHWTIRNAYGPSLNEKKEADIALFWCNAEHLKLYQDIMEVLPAFQTPKLRMKAVNESMKLARNCRGNWYLLQSILVRCKKLDEQGVEFMFWDSASRFLGVRH
jgi:hypothetical protein